MYDSCKILQFFDCFNELFLLHSGKFTTFVPVMDTKQLFYEAYSTLDQKEVAVLRDIRDYNSMYGHDIVSKYMTVIICHSGSARLLYDMQEVHFTANSIAVILPDHIMRPLECSPDYCVTFIMHSNAFCEELKTKRLTYDYEKFHLTPSCHMTDEAMALYIKALDVFEHICNSSIQLYPLRREMLIAQSNVMVELTNACRRELDSNSHALSRKQIVAQEFCNLLAMHYREQHEVAYYAGNIHLSPRHFSLIIKEATGLSASEYIEEYILTQARNLLSTRPDMSVQQISYHLGFSESPSFCRFFKRITGQTPSDYRGH